MRAVNEHRARQARQGRGSASPPRAAHYLRQGGPARATPRERESARLAADHPGGIESAKRPHPARAVPGRHRRGLTAEASNKHPSPQRQIAREDPNSGQEQCHQDCHRHHKVTWTAFVALAAAGFVHAARRRIPTTADLVIAKNNVEKPPSSSVTSTRRRRHGGFMGSYYEVGRIPRSTKKMKVTKKHLRGATRLPGVTVAPSRKRGFTSSRI